jgi:DNA-binding GntR family transcriptional regulator
VTLTKHQLIHSDIKAKIASGDLAPGDALPSQQELMSAYGVAQGTVRQALDRLAADGLVIAHKGKGTYVNQPSRANNSKRKLDTIGVVAIGNKDRFTVIHDALPTLQREAESQGCEVTIRYFDTGSDDQIVEWAKTKSGVLIWSAAKVSLVNRLIALRVPTALLGELSDGKCPPGASWIHFNIDDTASMAVQLLVSMGHRKVWFVSRTGTEYYDWFARAFVEQTQAAGIAQTCRLVEVHEIEEEPRVLTELKNTGINEFPSALLIEGDMRACRIVHMLEKAHCPVPGKISVMAIGACDPYRLGVRDLYRVITPPDTSAAIAVQALAESIRTGRVVRHIIAPRMSAGKTCVTLPAADA